MDRAKKGKKDAQKKVGFLTSAVNQRGCPEGPARHLDASRQKLTPHCLAAILTLNYPRRNCILKYLPNCLSPTREDIFSSFKIALVVRVTARQLSGKNCLTAIFASRHQDASPGPLGGEGFGRGPGRRGRSGWDGPAFCPMRVWGGHCARPMRLPDPSPVLDKILVPIGPGILSSTGAEVWRKAPMAFPDSNSLLDKFHSAI